MGLNAIKGITNGFVVKGLMQLVEKNLVAFALFINGTIVFF